jgi:hypothetical protein
MAISTHPRRNSAVVVGKVLPTTVRVEEEAPPALHFVRALSGMKRRT